MNQVDFWHADEDSRLTWLLDIVKNAVRQSDCRMLKSAIFQEKNYESM